MALQLGHLDFRGADCQLCFWGKQQLHQHQPTLSSLDIELGSVIVIAAFEQIEQLYQSASFDWGGVSSENHLPAYWKLDLQQHPTVYKQLADNLGQATPWPSLSTRSLQLQSRKLPQLQQLSGKQLRRA